MIIKKLNHETWEEVYSIRSEITKRANPDDYITPPEDYKEMFENDADLKLGLYVNDELKAFILLGGKKRLFKKSLFLMPYYEINDVFSTNPIYTQIILTTVFKKYHGLAFAETNKSSEKLIKKVPEIFSNVEFAISEFDVSYFDEKTSSLLGLLKVEKFNKYKDKMDINILIISEIFHIGWNNLNRESIIKKLKLENEKDIKFLDKMLKRASEF